MTIKIIFETQNGSTQYVAEVMQSQLQKLGHQVHLHSVKYQGNEPSLEGMDVVIFGAPTYDDGKLEKKMLEFITAFNPDFTQQKVAVFGLGNRTYPQFCVAADILEDWVKKNGGQLLVETLRVDGFPDHLEHIQAFTQSIDQAIK